MWFTISQGGDDNERRKGDGDNAGGGGWRSIQPDAVGEEGQPDAEGYAEGERGEL